MVMWWSKERWRRKRRNVVDALLDRLLSGEAAAAAGGATEGIGHNEPPVTLAERTCGTQRTMGRRRARSE
mgnify:CR=1 FL=1